MEAAGDPRAEVRGLNARLKGFLEHMGRLQDANARLEGQIADWGARNGSAPRDWSREESAVNGLRAQVRVTRPRRRLSATQLRAGAERVEL